MDRTSSGAIELAPDFTPKPGVDLHYISLPAYPFVNCTDTLVYDQLVAQAMQIFNVISALRPEDLAFQPSAKQQQAYDLVSTIYDSKLAVALRGLPKTKDPVRILHFVRTDDAVSLSKELNVSRSDAHEIIGSFTDAVEAILVNATRGAIVRDDLSFVTDRALPGMLLQLAELAISYGPTPCSSSLRYRDFLGYDADTEAPGVPWIDREQPEQLTALTMLADQFGVRVDRWPTSQFSFLHFSDVQIREPGAKLGGARLSHQLKRLVSSFEQDYVQELYQLYVYDAIIKTANAEIDLVGSRPAESADRKARPAPNMMINTGDSADTGMQTEFDTFMTYTNKLLVPWYQAIGNHDVLAFGNMRLSSVDRPNRTDDETCQGWGRVACTCTSLSTLVRTQEIRIPDNRGATKDALPDPKFTLFPLLLQRICLLHTIASDWFVMDPDKSAKDNRNVNNSVDSFILSHCLHWHPDPSKNQDFEQALRDCMAGKDDDDHRDPSRPKQYVHRPTAGNLCATVDGTTVASTMHGFDTLPGFDPLATKQDNLGGYYCFEMKAADPTAPRAWAIVLNTNTEAGAFGFISRAQLTWLHRILLDGDCQDRQIKCDDYVMLFSHHPIYAIYDQHQRLELTDIVTRSPNVIAYIAGHTHSSGLRTIRPLRGSSGHAKWEIVAPSVIDFPQAARQVTVKAFGELGYIEILTFSPHGDGTSVTKIQAAEKGAIRDLCQDPNKCDANGNAILPAREVTFPRTFFRTPKSTRMVDEAR